MWFFNSPRVIFGREAIDQLEMIEGSKVLVITDKDLVKLGMLDIVTKRLESSGKEYKVFDEVEPDPPIPVVKNAEGLCREYEPDLIVALGGGSSIDTAKGAWVLYEADEGYDVAGLNPFDTIPTGTKAKLIAVPTTSGTGAEVTGAVVLTDPESSLKLELLSRFAIPTVAIVDPVFADNMPKKLTASTAFDAIGHCMEGVTSTWGNVYTDALTLKALKMLFNNLSKAYHDSDPDAREAMHVGASIAGLAFGNAQAQLGHAFAHQIGAIFHVPHGFGVGLVLPYFMEFVMNNDPNVLNQFAEIGKSLGVAKWVDDDKTAGKKLLDKVRALQKDVDFPTKLEDLGITKEQLDENEQKFRDLIVQAGTFTMCTVSMDTDAAWKFMHYIHEGKNIDF